MYKAGELKGVNLIHYIICVMFHSCSFICLTKTLSSCNHIKTTFDFNVNPIFRQSLPSGDLSLEQSEPLSFWLVFRSSSSAGWLQLLSPTRDAIEKAEAREERPGRGPEMLAMGSILHVWFTTTRSSSRVNVFREALALFHSCQDHLVWQLTQQLLMWSC